MPDHDAPAVSQDLQAEIVEAAVTSRRSIRAFLPTPVPRETVERILAAASYAPSGSNMQPWKVRVVAGAAKDRLVAAVTAEHDAGRAQERDFRCYPDPFPEPYLSRRRATGWGLYGTLGIEKGDKAAMHRQHGRNFLFFDAPVGLIFTIDGSLEMGSWLDYGTFLQNIMVMARGLGLDTCPQAAWCSFHSTVKEVLEIPEDEVVVCGMALGHAAPDAVENGFRPVREPVAGFARFLDFD
ncbi:MAG: nitrobenzoate reductase [Rhodospirillales bacterium CG15_BIG_FIL_POST_REV_8_21_14_020_66_15]|nr:MAG: nitrobenzoate reductase [Rhodospirillales bacterium CG15_BIG_FIL_POST_REV_8_21_14_020_66_15]